MKIMKIGGAVLTSAKGFESLKRIISISLPEASVIVISAFGKTTIKLKNAAIIASKGDFLTAKELIDSILIEHKEIIRSNIINQTYIQKAFECIDTNISKATEIIKGVAITRELTPRTLDLVMSFGEFIASEIVNYFLLSNKFDSLIMNSCDVIVTDSNYGRAKPDYNLSLRNALEKIMPLAAPEKIIIVPGFIAKSREGEITTMGIESSNLTATLLASLLSVGEVIFWTDTIGLRDIDPKFYQENKHIPELSYDLAFKASIFGLKPVYPTMIRFAKDYNINLIFKSAFDDNNIESIIRRNSGISQLITIIEDVDIMTSDNFYSQNEIMQRNHISHNELDSSMEWIFQARFGDKAVFIRKSNGEELKSKQSDMYAVKALITIFNPCHILQINLLEMMKNQELSERISFVNYDYTSSEVYILVDKLILKTILNALLG